MPQYHYTAVFEPAPEGGYVVTVPALPGLVTEGDTREEALAMVKEAILGYCGFRPIVNARIGRS